MQKRSEDLEARIVAQFDATSAGDVVVESVAEGNFELRRLLQTLGEEGRGRRVLDAGCGKGKFAVHLAARGFSVTGIDPSAGLVREAQRAHPGIVFSCASVTDIPFADGSFDYVVCVEVLEHVPDIERAVAEMMRVLAPGGTLLIIDKNILSLHPGYFFPTVIWKWVLERRGRWFYPSDFPFREKYFVPWSLRATVRRHAREARMSFLQYVPDPKERTGMKKFMVDVHRALSTSLHKTIPALDFYVVWEGVK